MLPVLDRQPCPSPAIRSDNCVARKGLPRVTTFANALSGLLNYFVLWLPLIVMAVSAFFTLARTGRRDRNGLVDRTACAIGTVLSGPIMAAAIAFIPYLMVAADGTSSVSGSLTAQVGDTWVWIATVVMICWMYALASVIFVTSMYHRQQRRLRHHA